ncbi:GNAT family N-acetyltransferase [Dactylosporangium sp. NPDC000244]|uniref:GNAT family N-acetyltransferase n=1 Tax=Dactylosporangium sp. NPDC000244 TaxID=3154365 RepID=UPI00332E50B3
MIDRTIHLDPAPYDWQTRKITVSNGHLFATVTLDRDGYVETREHPEDGELSTAFKDAIKRVTDSAIERLWIAGHPHDFSYSSGPRYVTTFAEYQNLDETIEALQLAEIDGDVTNLHALADRLALPFDEWLAPGERELIRGVDFNGKPSALLEMLRSKAKDLELRLNGRATPSGVWINPRLSETGRLLRNAFPERFASQPDRWTDVEVPEPARSRPYVGGRDRSNSAGSKPIRWIDSGAKVDGDCPCGLFSPWGEYREDEHRRHHMAWSIGVRQPKNIGWWRGNIAVVTTESGVAWRRLAHRMARLPMRENHYDFASWSVGEHPEPSADNKRAYLLRANGYVIGYLTASDTDQHVRWDHGSTFGEADSTLRPRVDLIWVAAIHRSRGLGGRLVEALAKDFGCTVADVSWSSPVSAAGQRLAQRISPAGVWVS